MKEFSLKGDLVQQKGGISHFACSLPHGSVDIVMNTKSLDIITVEIDNSEYADEAFKSWTE